VDSPYRPLGIWARAGAFLRSIARILYGSFHLINLPLLAVDELVQAVGINRICWRILDEHVEVTGITRKPRTSRFPLPVTPELLLPNRIAAEPLYWFSVNVSFVVEA
jgi:hypothetical protein